MNMKRRHLRVYGIVQGVGFRPFVSRIADRIGVKGSVCNKGPYVEIFTEGTKNQVEEFEKALVAEAPERSAILKVEAHDEPVRGDKAFEIIKSEKVKGEIFVSPDIATCDKCKAELFDPKDRRYLHPFINCTACGPRLTILDSMPYDRVRTSMGEFPMCPECEKEYTSPESRRYHAQPVCCNDCGPRLYVIDPKDPYNASFVKKAHKDNILIEDGSDKLIKKITGDKESLVYIREVIRTGGIVAIKGIGGFHLCCDATNEEAVSKLRKLKARPFKPFAVMMKNMETVRRECVVLSGQEEVMEGPKKPILLLEKKGGNEAKICDSIAPDNPNVGVMLPYAPVQLLLFDYPDGKPMTDVFVMTSGNPKGAPICRTDEDAIRYLGGLCDAILSNARKIRLRADDTVMSWYNGGPYMIRRSRGYAPLPYMLKKEGTGNVLGIGGELKNTFCLATGSLYYLSPYIGDLADLRSVDALRSAVTRMENLLEIKPELVCCDMHPRYNSSAFARELGAPVLEIQHHYAHVLSCLAENDRTDKVIGVSFDGTGYGTDGTVWGGEILISDMKGFKRAASLASFPQAGGDKAPREGWRIAVALLMQALGEDQAKELILGLGICEEDEFNIQSLMIKNNINCIMSTSAGRVFDAASAVLGLRKCSTCEGEASMVLEFAAEAFAKKSSLDELERIYEKEVPAYLETGKYEGKAANVEEGKETGIRTTYRSDLLIGNLAKARAEGEDTERLAYIFHAAVSRLIRDACLKARKDTGLGIVALSGGVMQNILLMDMCREKLEAEGFEVLHHTLVPPNDGGIALGQAYGAMQYLEDNN